MKEIVPDRTEGIIVDRLKDRSVNIAWAYIPGLKVDAEASLKYQYSFDDITLVRPNTINFQKLYRECFRDGLPKKKE